MLFIVSVLILSGICAVWLHFRLLRPGKQIIPGEISQNNDTQKESTKTTSPKKQKPQFVKKTKQGQVNQLHDLQFGVIPLQKSPTTCVALSACGTRVATADKTGTIRVFAVGTESSATFQQVFWGVVDNDFPLAMDFGETTDYLYLILDLRRNLARVRLEKGERNRLPLSFCGEPDFHKDAVSWMCGSRGPFVVTCCRGGTDTSIKVSDTSGSLIGSYDTKQVQTYDFSYSGNDARFVGVAAWSSGVQILEIKRKGTSVSKITKAMDLKTNCGVLGFALSSDHTRALILKKGGTYCFFDIDVRYEDGERTKVIKEIEEDDEMFRESRNLSYVANDKLIMSISGRHIKFMDADTLKVVQLIENAHSSDIVYSNVARKSFVITYCRTGKPRLWRIPDGQ